MMAKQRKRKKKTATKPIEEQQPIKVSEERPTPCPRCRCNEVHNVRNSVLKEEHREIGGVMFTHARRFYCDCKHCGQVRVILKRLRQS